MKKIIVYNEEAKDKLKSGFLQLAKAVKITLGPSGNTVLLEKPNSLVITKDGVSVAKEVFLEDPVENIGANLLKEISIATNKEAGDGTTTATVLGEAILNEGFKAIKNGQSPIDVKRELDESLLTVSKRLEELSSPVELESEDLLNIAKISTNNDEKISKLVHELILKSKNSTVLLEESTTGQTYSEFVEGVSFNTSYVDTCFINTASRSCELDNPLLLIYNGKLQSSKQILPILEIVKRTERPFAIMAEEFGMDILTTLYENTSKGKIQCVAIKTPGFGPGRKEQLDDLAVYTNAEVIQKNGLNRVTAKSFGQMGRIIVKPEITIIKEGKFDKDRLDKRIADLESISGKLDEYTNMEVESRISKFKGGIGVMYVGAASEVEYKEKYDRIEDSINAVKASLQEGYISGGGTTLFKISNELDSIILREALKAPYKQILKNQGKQIKNEATFDITKDYNKFLEEGVIDPKKVTRVALENAISVAGTILTTECVIVNDI